RSIRQMRRLRGRTIFRNYGQRFEQGRILLRRNRMVRQAAGALAVGIALAASLGCKTHVNGDAMATVDGRTIFKADVDKYFDSQVSAAQQVPTGEQATALRLNILDQLIEDEILMRRAEKLGLLATDEDVDK